MQFWWSRGWKIVLLGDRKSIELWWVWWRKYHRGIGAIKRNSTARTRRGSRNNAWGCTIFSSYSGRLRSRYDFSRWKRTNTGARVSRRGLLKDKIRWDVCWKVSKLGTNSCRLKTIFKRPNWERKCPISQIDKSIKHIKSQWTIIEWITRHASFQNKKR